jgi:TELO2-interacting protein 1
MENVRQRAFVKLRPPCVELNAIALKFRGKQTSIKSVLQALHELHKVLQDLGQEDCLDAKLAEYAFFPLSHVLNESQRLSSRCLEVAVQSLQILVSKGWRQNIVPEMGKQLLILMTLLSGGPPTQTQTEQPSDDLKVAAFDCIEQLVEWMSKGAGKKYLFDDGGTKTIVDQATYLLLEAITDSPSDLVQLAAAKALSRLTGSINSRILLASLLPRTVSALTKALLPSTEIRRTHKVLAYNLRLLTQTLQRVLNDSVSFTDQSAIGSQESSVKASGEHEILGESWLKATSSQIKIALTNVAKLRNHERSDVREALLELCLMVIEECPKSLAESVPLMVEMMVALANDQNSLSANSALKHLATSNPLISDVLKSSLYTWSMSLPRLMQGSDDRPKQRALTQISTAFEILADTANGTDMLINSIASTLVDSVSTAVQVAKLRPRTAVAETSSMSIQVLNTQGAGNSRSFQPILLDHKSQEGSLAALQSLVKNLRAVDPSNSVVRAVMNRIPSGDIHTQLSSIWITLNLLRRHETGFTIDDVVENSSTSTGLRNSQPYLISDLYSFALPILLTNAEFMNDTETNWQLPALALECLVLQAEQLGASYRPELIDTLYPVLSLLGSQDSNLQAHAMTALNLLATACEYSSTQDLLVENVDYLVNSIAIKLNSFDLLPQPSLVLLMMVKLCGASLLPYLDDLIGSIFAALDNFHGYPQLVEMLFEVLKAIVDESTKKPQLTITDGKTPEHRKLPVHSSTLHDILGDLGAAKSRKRKHGSDEEEPLTLPHRPWSSSLDGPKQDPAEPSDVQLAENENDEGNLPVSSNNTDQDKVLSKSHQLLLSISQATTPHLSSPAPRVRLILLQLLDRIAPLLAQDENSFLPLINTIWPSLTARLFGEVGADGEGETAYNVCAAAETMVKLCEGAGDFMASRIEDIFPQLAKLYKQVWRRVQADKDRKSRRKQPQRPSDHLHGTVELRLVQSQAGPVATAKPQVLNPSYVSTTDAQIYRALKGLLVAILLNVRITDDNGDSILALLEPAGDGPEEDEVRGALENWNRDAVWIFMERKKIESDILDGQREMDDWEWRDVERPRIDHTFGALREVIF